MMQTFSMSHSGNLMGSLFPEKEAHIEASVPFTTAICFYNDKAIPIYYVPWLVRNQVLPKYATPQTPMLLSLPEKARQTVLKYTPQRRKEKNQSTSDERILCHNQGNILPTATFLFAPVWINS